MKRSYSTILCLLLFAVGPAFSQKSPDAFKFFGVRSYSGELSLRGYYRDRLQSGERINEKQQTFYYGGGILMNANAYLLHPNFCEIELGAGYMPESNRDNFLASPDQAEVRTVKKLNILTSFFNRKIVNVIASANYDESYTRRENLTDIKTTNKYVGGSLIYSNKYIPVTLDFYKRNLIQKEIQTKRVLTIDQIHFEGRAEQSFTAYDRQSLTYSHNNYSSVNVNDFRSANAIDDINFNSIFGLGVNRTFTFNTTISNVYQRGSFNYNRFQAMENLAIKLPANFTFNTTYNYYNITQMLTRMTQHTSLNSLNHKLFKSLDSRFFLEYTTINHTVYSEYNSKTGFEFNYLKKIPWGELRLSYGYFRYHQSYTSDSLNLNIAGEEYVLSDSKIVLLRRPYISIFSVVVKDVTGTIIYTSGIDYILVERGKYIEIRRIPSGLIPNDGAIFVDYTATQPSSYKYDADNNALSATLSLLHGKVDIYYRLAWQKYSNLENTDFITLNYYTQNVAGVRLGFNFISGGAEIEDYQSSILPYRMVRFYLSFQKNFANRLNLSLNGNIQTYNMLNEPAARVQQYADAAGKIEYIIVNRTKVNLDVMYRKQTGRGIDLDLLTARLELTSVIYQLFVTGGVEVYRRNYIGDKINFKGVYIQIVRKF